jgi:hypothetical protein
MNTIQKINFQNCAHLWKLKHITREKRPKYYCQFCNIIMYGKFVPVNQKNEPELNSSLFRIFSLYKDQYSNFIIFKK